MYRGCPFNKLYINMGKCVRYITKFRTTNTTRGRMINYYSELLV
jgi:hypothetical protein